MSTEGYETTTFDVDCMDTSMDGADYDSTGQLNSTAISCLVVAGVLIVLMIAFTLGIIAHGKRVTRRHGTEAAVEEVSVSKTVQGKTSEV